MKKALLNFKTLLLVCLLIAVGGRMHGLPTMLQTSLILSVVRSIIYVAQILQVLII